MYLCAYSVMPGYVASVGDVGRVDACSNDSYVRDAADGGGV